MADCLALIGLLLLFVVDSVDDLNTSCVSTYDNLGYSQCGQLAFNGGCQEHFSGLFWQDDSGEMTFSECCAKCDELNCKSFSFGNQGVSRVNWCNIYNVICTNGGDNHWHTFVPESTDDLDPSNYAVEWKFNGGCQEHFEANTDILYQDRSGNLSFSDCYFKCKETSNCSSFSFGKEGIDRTNWCFIYDVECTDSGDQDWNTYVPVRNSELVCEATTTTPVPTTAPVTMTTSSTKQMNETMTEDSLVSTDPSQLQGTPIDITPSDSSWPTTNTFSTTNKTDTAENQSFFQRMVTNIGVVSGIIALIVSCAVIGCYLFYRVTCKNKVNHEHHRNNRALDVQKQPTVTLTPPGVGGLTVSLQTYMSVSHEGDDVETTISTDIDIDMEGVPIMEAKEDMLNDLLNDVLRQPSRNDMKSDSERMYVIPKKKHDLTTQSDDIDCELNNWLTMNGFAHYLDNFVLHGYDSLEFVKDIHDVQDLIAIDITRKADQHKLMSLIELQQSEAVIGDHNVTVRQDRDNVAMHVEMTSR
eukprot:650501_1